MRTRKNKTDDTDDTDDLAKKREFTFPCIDHYTDMFLVDVGQIQLSTGRLHAFRPSVLQKPEAAAQTNGNAKHRKGTFTLLCLFRVSYAVY